MVQHARAQVALLILLALSLCSGGCYVTAYQHERYVSAASKFFPYMDPIPPAPKCSVTDPCFFGHQATCWHPWPSGWVGCPPCVIGDGTHQMNVVGEVQPQPEPTGPDRGFPPNVAHPTPPDLPVTPSDPVPADPPGVRGPSVFPPPPDGPTDEQPDVPVEPQPGLPPRPVQPPGPPVVKPIEPEAPKPVESQPADLTEPEAAKTLEPWTLESTEPEAAKTLEPRTVVPVRPRSIVPIEPQLELRRPPRVRNSEPSESISAPPRLPPQRNDADAAALPMAPAKAVPAEGVGPFTPVETEWPEPARDEVPVTVPAVEQTPPQPAVEASEQSNRRRPQSVIRFGLSATSKTASSWWNRNATEKGDAIRKTGGVEASQSSGSSM